MNWVLCYGHRHPLRLRCVLAVFVSGFRSKQQITFPSVCATTRAAFNCTQAPETWSKREDLYDIVEPRKYWHQNHSETQNLALGIARRSVVRQVSLPPRANNHACLDLLKQSRQNYDFVIAPDITDAAWKTAFARTVWSSSL